MNDLRRNRIVATEKAFSVTPVEITSGSEVATFDTWRLKPLETKNLFTNGPAGTHVSITLQREPNSGGHYHGGASNNPLAVGTVTPNDFVISGAYPQNIVSIFTAPEICGVIHIHWASSNNVVDHMFEVMFDSFLPIPQTVGIELKPPEPIHPSPYWADVTFINKLKALGEQFHARFKKNIVITDASLPWGGRFDIKANDPKDPKEWQAPHAEHRNGKQADIRLWSMSDHEQKAFLEICAGLGITAQIDQPQHWHIRG